MKQIEGSARRVLKESKRLATAALAVCLIGLGYMFFYREDVSATALFWGVLAASAAAGANIAILLRNLD